MKKSLGHKAIVSPLPVFIIGTYDENGNPDVMNAAWGTQYEEDEIIITLGSSHKTTENIKVNKAFTVSFGTKSTVVLSDYFGLVSANDCPDKVKNSGAHLSKSESVNAPIIEEYPLTLECVLSEIRESDGDSRVVGKVVNVLADESILDERGKVDLTKAEIISYDSSAHAYRVLGEKVGKAFHDGLSLKK